MPRQWLTSFAFVNFILATKCRQNAGIAFEFWRPRSLVSGQLGKWINTKCKTKLKDLCELSSIDRRLGGGGGGGEGRQSLATTYLAQQIQCLFHAHHQQIKTIQLLQQHHTDGRHAHLHLLAYAPCLEGGWKLFQYARSHLVDELIPTDAARALACMSLGEGLVQGKWS